MPHANPNASTALRRLAVVPTLTLALLAMAGCRSGGGANTMDTDRLDDLPTLPIEAELRLGSFEDPDLGFSRIGGVDVDRDGNLYVVEVMVPEIRVYDPDGNLLRRIGRRGEGPGEFESTPQFGVMGDTVWAIEGWKSRLTLFDRRGETLATGLAKDVLVPLPSSSFGHVRPVAMRPDGRFRSFFNGRSYNPRGAADVESTDRIRWPFVLFDATGAVTDTIGWAERPPPLMWRPPSEADPMPKQIEVAGQRMFVPSPPTLLPRWLDLPDGYITVETPLPSNAADGTLLVTRIGLQGDTVYSRTLHYRPLPYTSEDLDSIAAKGARGEPGGGVGYRPGAPPPDNWRAIAARYRAEMDYPAFQLPIQYAWVGQDQSVWLELTAPGNAPTATWVVLNVDGQPRARVELPAKASIRWSRGDTFWAVEPDELDTPFLVRYRIGS